MPFAFISKAPVNEELDKAKKSSKHTASVVLEWRKLTGVMAEETVERQRCLNHSTVSDEGGEQTRLK